MNKMMTCTTQSFTFDGEDLTAYHFYNDDGTISDTKYINLSGEWVTLTPIVFKKISNTPIDFKNE